MSANDADLAGSPAIPREAGGGNAVMRYFARFDEGEVIRWAFRGLLAGAIGVLVFDFQDLWGNQPLFSSEPTSHLAAPAVLPPAVTVSGGEGASLTVDPRDNLTTDETALRAPVAFTLRPGGVLAVEGYIDNGSKARFETELASRGEYVETVSLNSPGGSLDDAIGMATLIRERGLATTVEDGALCASSCPLILAGGTSRTISAKAAVGVHQFYSVSADPGNPAQAMADAQATTARISRHLAAMGVDAALWLHALDTPPRSLYYLSADQMRDYGLATGNAQVAAK